MLGGFMLTGWLGRKQTKTPTGGQRLVSGSLKLKSAPRTVAREPRVG